MSSEIEVPETPNWLKDLEEKRERRLKVRLGHEAGAGAPCLKCEDKCPGLDLHFWRKACKICRCPKEEHDVPDDDIYGWAQFQLLGSKPNKVKTKIVLPGKKDEVELDWAPKGQKDTIDKYLKTLPPESLPVKGSQAAQERKQLLQKQIPVHDIDPSLCHELNEEEVKKMEDYIDHVKKSSVGVGQIVNLSSVIKANLHNISPQEAHLIASRYSKGVPLSELVKLQAGLAKNLENLAINSPKKPPLKQMQQTNLTKEETLQNPLLATKFKDITHPWYSNASPGKDAQKPPYSFDEKLLQGTNFDPSKTPSQFKGYHPPGYKPKDPYGFENPYFNQERNPQAPKSVKDLIYSTYDPSKGPVPQDEGSQRGLNPQVPGYDPNLVLNTYKHDPSVFQSVPMDPAKEFRGKGVDPVTGKYLGPRFDPETGKYVEEERRYPLNVAAVRVIFDPVTGKYLPIEEKDPKSGKVISGSQLQRFDPETGKYVREDYQYPQNSAVFDPVTGKYTAIDEKGNAVGKPLTRFDPEAKIYVKEDSRYPQNVGIDPVTGKTIPGGQIPRFDPETGNYVEENRRYPQNVAAGRVIFDPDTGRYLTTEERDPKTGKVIPGSQLQRFDPETGKYVREDCQYPQNSAVFDPVTGKYTPIDEKGNVVGKPLSRFDPEAKIYVKEDCRYPQNVGIDPVTGKIISGGQIDPETGKYIHENVKNPQYSADSGTFDPITGKYLPSEEASTNPVTGKIVPGNPISRFDPETGSYIQDDFTYPQNAAGKYLPHEKASSKLDPVTGRFNAGLARFDPESGKYLQEESRYPLNVASGAIYDPVSGQYFTEIRDAEVDPVTGQPIKYNPEDSGYPQNVPAGGVFDPVTGKFLPGSGIDPVTGTPIRGHQTQYPRLDPETGKYIQEDPRYPQNMPGSTTFDPVTGKSNQLPRFDRETGKYPGSEPPRINPATGQPWTPNDVPIFDPVTGKYIPEEQRLAMISGQPGLRRFEPKKPLSSLQPGQINVPEDYLEPHMVNIGAIQDINPEIRAATTKLNPGFQEDVTEENNADYSPDSIKEILNNIKLPDCHYCKKPFEENEFAVTIDRANVLFHAQCFKCAGCNQSLADNIYFYYKDTNNVYCGRDYAKIMGYPRCSACDELIFTKEYCLAENSTFHLKHFCCFQCDTPLAGQDYTLEDEKPYCLPCFETSKAAKCSTCEKVIKPDEVGCQLNGVHFHAEDRCFRCIVCSVPLMEKKMLLRNEKLYCSHECFNAGKK